MCESNEFPKVATTNVTLLDARNNENSTKKIRAFSRAWHRTRIYFEFSMAPCAVHDSCDWSFVYLLRFCAAQVRNRSMCTCFELLFVFIHSVATCLGARTVAAKALEWTQNHKIINHVCSDEEAVSACERFAGT